MPAQEKANSIRQLDKDLDVTQIGKQLDVLDQRLDSIDSVITSIVERLMERPVILEVTCPRCRQTIQINITSSVKLRE